MRCSAVEAIILQIDEMIQLLQVNNIVNDLHFHASVNYTLFLPWDSTCTNTLLKPVVSTGHSV